LYSRVERVRKQEKGKKGKRLNGKEREKGKPWSFKASIDFWHSSQSSKFTKAHLCFLTTKALYLARGIEGMFSKREKQKHAYKTNQGCFHAE